MALVRVHSAEAWIAKFGSARKRTAVTIGNFDGVHRGHQDILRRTVELARKTGALATVLTFYPHPARVLRPEKAPPLIMTLDQRLAAFDALGVEAALILSFDEKLAQRTAEDFVKIFLMDALRASTVLVGGNFRFGHAQAGDVKLLERLGTAMGFAVEIVAPVGENGVVVSSTGIRKAVSEGLMEEAARMLGRPFALAGEIQTGTGMGRKFVVPTLNQKTPQELLPRLGVYATETFLQGRCYQSATNVGTRPTFEGKKITIETHLLDFNENLTDGPMEIRFLTRLRGEQKFPGPEALREQILKDIQNARKFFEMSSRADANK